MGPQSRMLRRIEFDKGKVASNYYVQRREAISEVCGYHFEIFEMVRKFADPNLV